MNLVPTLISACLLIAAPASGQEASFRGLGQLPGYVGTEVSGISADGRSVAGTAGSVPSAVTQAFLWRDGVLQALGQVPGSPYGTKVSTISSDGSFVSGWTYGNGPMWSWRDGVLTPTACNERGFGGLASPGDGSIWYYRNYTTFPPGTTRVFANGDCEPALAMGQSCLVAAVPDDESFLSVYLPSLNLGGLLFPDGSLLLPPWRVGLHNSNFASRNGRFVLGAALWDREEGTVYDIGNHTPPRSYLGGGEQPLSDTGVVVGVLGIGPGLSVATAWTKAQYWDRRLDCGLRRLGLGDALAGWQLTAAVAISADGHTIIGQGVNPAGVPEGWIAVMPSVPLSPDFNQDRFVDFFDYDDFIEAFETGDPRADFNQDEFLDFFDYDEFVAAFEQGC